MTPRFVQKNAAIVLLLFSAGCGGGGSSGGAMIEEVSGSNNSDPLTVATGFASATQWLWHNATDGYRILQWFGYLGMAAN
ncbi:MAG: hypothetical protein GWP50_00195 [Proteobacteria bacterium]|nr:hypothetical protein [Pseudomonadota bacterium]